MIPYIQIPDGHIGPVPLHPFGVLVATGVLLGTGMTARRARWLGWDVVKLNSFITWMLVTGFVLSHVLDSLLYHWSDVVKRPWSIIMLWEGLSSFGGFFGAIVGVILWRYFVIEDGRPRIRATPHPILPFCDIVASCLPLGWMFGRAGCASVHDHPGARAGVDTLLAVAWPVFDANGNPAANQHFTELWFIKLWDGHAAPRFDLGLLELFFTILLTTCFALTWRKRLPLGSYVIAMSMSYAPVRFAMDFLRIPESEGGDTRYLGLTPAQYGCMGLFVFAVALIFYVRSLRKRGVDPTLAVLAVPQVPGEPAGATA
jgi:phosphatidylglycerol---prolipoprotein diacylglyceryl transferase